MKPSHVAGGGLGTLLGALVVGLAKHFGLSVTDVDAALVGSAALGVGVGVAHAIWTVGLFPLCRRVITGPKPPAASVVYMTPASTGANVPPPPAA